MPLKLDKTPRQCVLTRHCSKYFTYTNSFNPLNNPVREIHIVMSILQLRKLSQRDEIVSEKCSPEAD